MGRGLNALFPVLVAISFIVLAISFSFVGQASAQEGPVEHVIYPNGDADVSSVHPDEVLNHDIMGAGRVFLKFDLSSIPQDATVISASLRLRVGGAPYEWLYSETSGKYYLIIWPRSSVSCPVYGVEDDSWSEETITWNDQPALGDWISSSSMGGDWTDWDVTAWVQSQISGQASFCIINHRGIVFASKELLDIGGPEGDTRPYLEVLVQYNPPDTPYMPLGPDSGYVDTPYIYWTSTTDPNNDQVRYRFDWDDGNISDWTEWVPSGSWGSASHSWTASGAYYVKAQAQNHNFALSGWSSSLTVMIGPPDTPSTPSGPSSGYVDTTYDYSTSATDPDGDQVRYRFDWGDGNISDWTGLVSSGSSASKSHSWSSPGTYYVKAQAQDNSYAESGWSSSLVVTISEPNNPPNTPSMPSGPSSGYVNTPYTYSTSATDPDGDNVKYFFDWGDNTGTWTDWVSSGSTASASHSWSSPSTYYVRVKVQDMHGAENGWSSSLAVTIEANNPPNTPSTPSGPIWGHLHEDYTYSTSTTDNEGNMIRYRFDYGGGGYTEWGDLVPSGTEVNCTWHWFGLGGEYYARAQAQDEHGATSDWSPKLRVAIEGEGDSTNVPGEIGVWAVDDYPPLGPGGDDLDHAVDDAAGFKAVLNLENFVCRFRFWDEDAWESHFEKLGVGGLDYSFVDNVDIAYFAGHGSPEAFKFGVDEDWDRTHTYQVHFSEAEWGDGDLEWIIISSCEVLHLSTVWEHWENAFDNHLHGIAGFHTVAPDRSNYGSYFAKYLTGWGV